MVPVLLHQVWLMHMTFACIAITLHVQAWLACLMQAAALGGQLAAHCRREGDLGLVSPQELLQSAQRQRCYLGYIPQPPQVCMYISACGITFAIAFDMFARLFCSIRTWCVLQYFSGQAAVAQVCLPLVYILHCMMSSFLNWASQCSSGWHIWGAQLVKRCLRSFLLRACQGNGRPGYSRSCLAEICPVRLGPH